MESIGGPGDWNMPAGAHAEACRLESMEEERKTEDLDLELTCPDCGFMWTVLAWIETDRYGDTEVYVSKDSPFDAYYCPECDFHGNPKDDFGADWPG